MLAKDVMRKDFATVSPDMSLREAMEVFLERGITGAPVVDPKGGLVGVISQTDIVRRDRKAAAEVGVPAYHREAESSDHAAAHPIEDANSSTVADVMTFAVLSADEKTPIEEVARFMLRKRIHRIIITGAGKPVGLITSMDMLRAVVALAAGSRRQRTVKAA